MISECERRGWSILYCIWGSIILYNHRRNPFGEGKALERGINRTGGDG
jgi:hypothetical protein